MGAQDWGSKAPKVVGLVAGATITLDPSLGTIFTWNPNEAETVNASSPGLPGEQISVFIDTINGTTRNITFTGNFRSQGVLATGAVSGVRFVLSFISNGIVWSEHSRTVAMA